MSSRLINIFTELHIQIIDNAKNVVQKGNSFNETTPLHKKLTFPITTVKRLTLSFF
jgi:hypothetical protein